MPLSNLKSAELRPKSICRGEKHSLSIIYVKCFRMVTFLGHSMPENLKINKALNEFTLDLEPVGLYQTLVAQEIKGGLKRGPKFMIDDGTNWSRPMFERNCVIGKQSLLCSQIVKH